MARPPPTHPKKVFQEKSSSCASACGPLSPSVVGEGRVQGLDWPGGAHKNWPMRQFSLPEGGCAAQSDGGVADKIKKFEAERSQNKQVIDSPLPKATADKIKKFEAERYQNKQVIDSPLPKATFVYYGDDRNTPLSRVLQQDIHLDSDGLMAWWLKVREESWEHFVKGRDYAKKEKAEQFTVTTQRVLKAVQLYSLLLNRLTDHITELNATADNLDKFSKGTKIAGITGGATGAVGGAAAVAGVLLAPVTLGASLALTVLGVGVAAAGGVTGASAAITNKVSGAIDRKKIEQILQEFSNTLNDIEACLTFINVGMEHLRKHDLSTLNVVNTAAYRIAKAAEVTGVASTGAVQASSKLSGSLRGFACGMDMYFSDKSGKGGPKLKRRLASEFARKVREVAQQLDEGLNELFKVKDDFVANNLVS